MSSRPAKRARSNTGTHAVDHSNVTELIDSMDPKTIKRLLITAAKTYPDIASLVQREFDRIAAAEPVKVIDFDYLSKSVWKTLNVTYDRLKDSQAYEMAETAARSIEGDIGKIGAHCPKTASFKTKENALETLRKIGKSICLSIGVIGREIRKSYGSGGILVSTMFEITQSLTHEEIERLRPWCDDKMVELLGIANDCCIFEDLGEVIDLWGEDRQGERESSSDSNEDVESLIGDEDEAGSEGLEAYTCSAAS